MHATGRPLPGDPLQELPAVETIQVGRLGSYGEFAMPSDLKPNPEQITVLYSKFIAREHAPYADFSVLAPSGWPVQRQLKAKGYFLPERDSWKQAEASKLRCRAFQTSRHGWLVGRSTKPRC